MNPFTADKDYAGQLGFGKRPCLIVIDMIRSYTEPSSSLYAPTYHKITSAVVRLLAVVRGYDVPVVFTTLSYDQQHQQGGHFLRKITALQQLTRQPELSELQEGLHPLSGEQVFAKQYASAFFGTSLLSFLNYRRADSLIITGVSTSGCVRATATDAMQYGLIPMVVMDAVGDRSEEIHRANLYDLQMKYADIYTSDDIINHLKKL
jgi:maleamate amidohydrolase